MKKLILVALGAIFTVITSCSDTENDVNTTETILTQAEIDDLKFLREEEKLARDVYLFSYEKYGDKIFNNISKSEQSHMNGVLMVLNAYQIADPSSTERGVFNDEFLQNLYNDLIAKSDISLIEALKVGALIEDLDIKDLEDLRLLSSKDDIIQLCEVLECGSRNHMRSFINQLEIYDVSYTPIYISLEDYTEIINDTKELCGTY